MTKPLTAHAQYGLMRPVARIAQSVEQGIENPCVLGSIPSPGTIFKETRLWRVFCFLRYGLSIELRSIIRLMPCGGQRKSCATLSGSRILVKETRLWRVFCFLRFMAFSLRNNTIPPSYPLPDPDKSRTTKIPYVIYSFYHNIVPPKKYVMSLRLISGHV